MWEEKHRQRMASFQSKQKDLNAEILLGKNPNFSYNASYSPVPAKIQTKYYKSALNMTI